MCVLNGLAANRTAIKFIGSNEMLEKLPEAVGKALQGQRAGLEKIAFYGIKIVSGNDAILVASQAFRDNEPIPIRYTADGEGTSPPLQWSGIPDSATSIVLIVEDPDAPTPQPFVHAIVVGLPAGDGSLGEGDLTSSRQKSASLKIGRNSFLQAHWLPPDPPRGHGVHRYVFQVFALTSSPKFSDSPGRDEVEKELQRSAAAAGCLVGTYERKATSGRESK